jgi:hypothetical protein
MSPAAQRIARVGGGQLDPPYRTIVGKSNISSRIVEEALQPFPIQKPLV